MDCSCLNADDFLDLLAGQSSADDRLSKLVLSEFSQKCEPFNTEVVLRLAEICFHLEHLEINDMGIPL